MQEPPNRGGRVSLDRSAMGEVMLSMRSEHRCEWEENREGTFRIIVRKQDAFVSHY